jgi:hypothetical protein
MKNIFLLLLVVPLLSLTTISNDDKFVGKWVGEDKNELGYIIFDNEGYATLGLQGQVLGGKEFVMKGEKGSMTFEINEGANPIEIDLVVTKLDSGDQKKLLCIAQFISDNEMQFALSFTSQRPMEFTEANSIVLKREI